MSHEALSKRFRVDVGRADDGRSFVRVHDSVTGLSKTQIGFGGKPADVISRRLASQIIVEAGSLVEIAKIFMADIYCDGGAYSFCFYSPDGDWFEFFVQVKWDVDKTVCYETPTLYFHSANEGNIVRTFSWEEALQFLKPLHFNNTRFRELVCVIQNRGNNR